MVDRVRNCVMGVCSTSGSKHAISSISTRLLLFVATKKCAVDACRCSAKLDSKVLGSKLGESDSSPLSISSSLQASSVESLSYAIASSSSISISCMNVFEGPICLSTDAAFIG